MAKLQNCDDDSGEWHSYLCHRSLVVFLFHLAEGVSHDLMRSQILLSSCSRSVLGSYGHEGHGMMADGGCTSKIAGSPMQPHTRALVGNKTKSYKGRRTPSPDKVLW